MHSRQIEWEQLLGKWWDFQVSALHFISMLNKRYKFRWYLFQSTAITKMTLGGATWQCQGMKNFTLVAHWGNSYSYSFLRVTPFDFLTTFEIFKGKSQNDHLSRQKSTHRPTLYGFSNWLFCSLSDACGLFNHFCDFL